MIEHFHRPASLREAVGLKLRYRGRAAFLAGGTYVNSSACATCPDRRPERLPAATTGIGCSRPCAVRPAHVISLAGLPLDRIEAGKSGLSIGALCTLQRLIEDRKVPAPLKAASSQVVSRNVREAATLGGHVAGNLPYSDVIPMLVALEAKVALSGTGRARTIPVSDYVRKPVAGLVTKILLPRSGSGRVAACRNSRASANARSTVSAAVSLTAAKDAVKRPIIALSGIAGHVTRLTAVEDALDGKPLPALNELQALVAGSVRPAADLSGGAEFRRYQAGVVVALALRDAWAGKRGRS